MPTHIFRNSNTLNCFKSTDPNFKPNRWLFDVPGETYKETEKVPKSYSEQLTNLRNTIGKPEFTPQAKEQPNETPDNEAGRKAIEQQARLLLNRYQFESDNDKVSKLNNLNAAISNWRKTEYGTNTTETGPVPYTSDEKKNVGTELKSALEEARKQYRINAKGETDEKGDRLAPPQLHLQADKEANVWKEKPIYRNALRTEGEKFMQTHPEMSKDDREELARCIRASYDTENPNLNKFYDLSTEERSKRYDGKWVFVSDGFDLKKPTAEELKDKDTAESWKNTQEQNTQIAAGWLQAQLIKLGWDPKANKTDVTATGGTGTETAEALKEKPGEHYYQLGQYEGAKALTDDQRSKATKLDLGSDATEHAKESINPAKWYADKINAAKVMLELHTANRFDAATGAIVEAKKELLTELSTKTAPKNFVESIAFKTAFEKTPATREWKDIGGKDGLYNFLIPLQRGLNLYGDEAKLKAATGSINITVGGDINTRTQRFARVALGEAEPPAPVKPPKAPEVNEKDKTLENTDEENEAEKSEKEKGFNFTNKRKALKAGHIVIDSKGDAKPIDGRIWENSKGKLNYATIETPKDNDFKDTHQEAFERKEAKEKNISFKNRREALRDKDIDKDDKPKESFQFVVKERNGTRNFAVEPIGKVVAPEKPKEAPDKMKGMAEELTKKGFEMVITPKDSNEEGYAKLGDKRISVKFVNPADKLYTFKVLNISEGNPEIKSDVPLTADAMKVILDQVTTIDATKGLVEDLKHLPNHQSKVEALTGKYKIKDKEIPYEANTYKVTINNAVVETNTQTHAKSAPFTAEFEVTVKDGQYEGKMKDTTPLDEDKDVNKFIDKALKDIYDNEHSQ